MKIVTIVGARPQFIKASVLSRIFVKNNIKEIIIHTGQHFDVNMSDIFFEQMKIPKPSYFLNIHSSSHAHMTGEMMGGIEKILINEKPDYLLVYGDTNSTLAGALAASKLKIKIVHVEAGLRSFNMEMPEEINRIVTDRLSRILFCPTRIAKQNLMNEGYDKHKLKVVISGDVMYDATLYFSQMPPSDDRVIDIIKRRGSFVLCTIHRAENTDIKRRLQEIFSALEKIHQQIPVILPLHPRTKKYLSLYDIKTNVCVIEPVGYVDMIKLIQNCRLVITDSGGLQKEAYFCEKYCITARDETEWKELVDHGYNMLVGSSMHRIYEAYNNYKDKPFKNTNQFYGNGGAAEVICESLCADYRETQIPKQNKVQSNRYSCVE